ncbi:citrate-Mg2+:H+ or citrate-Ca2+:H+ symporter, CitMHS family [Streptomyces sp. 2224.1]|uniref:CitMHS family transporter n=1 Tax=unclassified Streptomyces TaxID=2593676 RepID=UPI0008904720|nr:MULTISPECIES: citrate:proton symporter [unclassified Streptomyces]PBC81556.1 CitMHS family citrate-Mg2+:H+ or citrate-Ca2+:H+ symporter [Streptomyces sp. 2321.6]SDR54321.1 citrate-Mg2+:H+ or citrate-Ca2+:H+ symporter, CitMHS family [Streptomyces sp. KS_16]SEC20281.1 citrate-Mg2+:H+ or citrate-Ca2+:H+ symporter, CitMHS family [Streptomyces sp. 2133.1]SED12186.1 citrate-Mg2+:H+ or citrate-Ca2+:H+ symporter, CitMHS family [Streptomyces sp. 2224.1]SEF06924.1 citrate-Mg2+:H+ or citrate-Ca2+:H+ s
MLTILGFVMIAAFLALIMMKKMSPMAALVLIPALFCVLVGQGAHLGDYVLKGIGDLAPTAAMLMFAIIYFGVMIDVGLFDPVVRGILRFCKADPVRVVLGTALLAAIVSLDGDGSTTFMITVSALYPLYKRLKMSLVVMTGVAATANGVMNTLPWGGPTARAATALKLDAGDIFVPMIPALAVGLVAVFALAYVLGRRERKRLGTLTLGDTRLVAGAADERESAKETEQVLVGAGAGGAGGAGGTATAGGGAQRGTGGAGTGSASQADADADSDSDSHSDGGTRTDTDEGLQVLDPQRATLRPKLYWFNAALTVALLTLLILQALPIPVLFLLGAALALTVNFPHMKDQKARVAAHAENVLNVSGMVFAAAVFTGVLTGTGMVEHMARWLVSGIPDALGPHMGIVTGVLSIPLTYFMSNDGFYFGIVPILAEAGAAHGVAPIEIARASLVGQALHMSSPLVPAVYVLVGMAKVEFGDHTKFTVKWAALTSLVVLGAGVLFGIL